MEKLCVAIEFALKCQASQVGEEAAVADLETAGDEVDMAIATVEVVLEAAAVAEEEEDLASIAVKVVILLANAQAVAEVVVVANAEMAVATGEIVAAGIVVAAIRIMAAEEMGLAVMDTRVEGLEGEIATAAALQEDSAASLSFRHKNSTA